MNSKRSRPFKKSKEPTQNSFQSRLLEYSNHRQYSCNKSFNTETIKSVDFILELSWNRDETAKPKAFENII